MLRLSVPADGGLRGVAREMATRVAVYLGSRQEDAESAGNAVEGLAERVAPQGAGGEIMIEFSEVDRELLIRVRCDGRSFEARCPLPE
jgi:anti-sigma regulatory factor (Ser/Thr protein kinase)